MGNPLAITRAAANGAERKEVGKLTVKIKEIFTLSEGMTVLEVDKGYDTDWLRQAAGTWLINTGVGLLGSEALDRWDTYNKEQRKKDK